MTFNHCEELNLIDKCKQIPSRKATKEEVLTIYDQKTFDTLETTSRMTDTKKLELKSNKCDEIYIQPSTFDFSLLYVGCTIDLVDKIVTRKVQNGIAIIRPPGDNEIKSEFNSFSFFNNVAIATHYCLNVLNLKKILIVDCNIRGERIERIFYDDSRVLYFSIHRLEFDELWRNQRKFDCDWIGEGEGTGFKFNIPLNEKIIQIEDYFSIFQQILLPVSYEVSKKGLYFQRTQLQ